MFGKLMPAESTPVIEGVVEDKKNGRKLGQYRFGQLAVYLPDNTYIARNAISNIVVSVENIPTKGCCGIPAFSPTVTFYVDKRKFRLLASSEKQAASMRDALVI